MRNSNGVRGRGITKVPRAPNPSFFLDPDDRRGDDFGRGRYLMVSMSG